MTRECMATDCLVTFVLARHPNGGWTRKRFCSPRCQRRHRDRRLRGHIPREEGKRATARRDAIRAKHAHAERRLRRAAKGTRGAGIWVAGPCVVCMHPFVRRTKCSCCSKRCRKRLDNRLRRDAYGNHRERARYYGVDYQPVDRHYIFKRDGYRCQLCGIKTKGKWPKPQSPTLDHIIPMVCGGPHAESNLQCACAACNSRKGERAANDQLRLV